MNHRLRTILSQGIEILAICGLTMTAIAQDNLPSPSSPLMDQDTFEHLMNTAPHKLLIVGRWRGFHQIEEKSFYYLYEFRADGTYRARHRLYEKNEQEFTETFWQGTWDFKDQFVEIEGNEVNEPEKRVKLQFKLAEDNFLYATPQENESLSLILPRKMGKQ